MRDLKDRLHDVDLMTPPDVWGQALRREPSQGLQSYVDAGPHGDGSPSDGRGRRVLAATIAIVVFIAAAWFAFGRCPLIRRRNRFFAWNANRTGR